MSALELALQARRYGVSFAYDDDGHIAAHDLHKLPAALRNEVTAHIDDVLAVVAEHSEPASARSTDILVDIARAIAIEARNTMFH